MFGLLFSIQFAVLLFICWIYFAAGVCWLVGHPLPGDERQERHQRRAGFHDHGRWDQEAYGPRGHSWWRQTQPKNREHPCQAVWRGLLLKDPFQPTTPVTSTISTLTSPFLSFCVPPHPLCHSQAWTPSQQQRRKQLKCEGGTEMHRSSYLLPKRQKEDRYGERLVFI